MAAKLAQSVGMICTSTGAGRCWAQPTDTVVANNTARIDVFMCTVYDVLIYWSSPQRLSHPDQPDHHGLVFGVIGCFDLTTAIQRGATHLGHVW